MSKRNQHPATIAAHAAGAKDDASGGIGPGIDLASTYRRDAGYELLHARNSYARDHNDTVRAAESVLRQLERAAEALLFPSGMAAVAALFRTVPTGGRVVMQSGIYWGVTKWVQDFCARRGIALVEVDASDLSALSAACAQPANIVWIETPSNPWLKCVNITAAADIAHGAGAVLAVDGTAATPILTRALEHGADISMHSGTKAINGHSDVLAGVLSCRDAGSDLWSAICEDRQGAGAIIGPFEAWLLMRGLRTLPLRVERMSENAMALAQFLQNDARIEAVWYPGLPDHAGHAVAARQMQGGYGGLMSVLIKGDEAAALAVAGRLQLFQRATSLGGTESLVEHRHTIEPHSGIPVNLLRLSVGIEAIEDLKADFDQAL